MALWENSAEADFATTPPAPVLLLHVAGGKIIAPDDFTPTPKWAKSIVAAALKATR